MFIGRFDRLVFISVNNGYICGPNGYERSQTSWHITRHLAKATQEKSFGINVCYACAILLLRVLDPIYISKFEVTRKTKLQNYWGDVLLKLGLAKNLPKTF